MRAADAITDAVAAHHDVLVLRRRPAHHNAVDQWAHVQRTGLVGNAGFWTGRGDSSETQNKADDECSSVGRGFLPSRSLSNVSAVVHSVAGPVPFTVMAETRKEYSVPRSRPGQKGNRFRVFFAISTAAFITIRLYKVTLNMGVRLKCFFSFWFRSTNIDV